MAEREGFEPSIRFCRILTFQASAFDHSATAPHALEGVRPSGARPAPQALARGGSMRCAGGGTKRAQSSHGVDTKTVFTAQSACGKRGKFEQCQRARAVTNGPSVSVPGDVGKWFVAAEREAGFAPQGFGGTMAA